MKTIVIESHEENGVEWGISSNGSNPESKDYFKMPDKETAFRLSNLLNGIEAEKGTKEVLTIENMSKTARDLYLRYKSGENWVMVDKGRQNMFAIGFEACAIRYVFK